MVVKQKLFDATDNDWNSDLFLVLLWLVVFCFSSDSWWSKNIKKEAAMETIHKNTGQNVLPIEIFGTPGCAGRRVSTHWQYIKTSAQWSTSMCYVHLHVFLQKYTYVDNDIFSSC